jgi:hypothetical protein
MQQQTAPTHISQRRLVSLSNMHQVLFLLNWSELRYCWHKYRQGLAYLKAVTGADEGAYHALERSATYWGWWKNHWATREEEFIMEVEAERFPPRQYRMRYEDLHEGIVLGQGAGYFTDLMEKSLATLFPLLMRDCQRQALIALETAGI